MKNNLLKTRESFLVVLWEYKNLVLFKLHKENKYNDEINYLKDFRFEFKSCAMLYKRT